MKIFSASFMDEVKKFQSRSQKKMNVETMAMNTEIHALSSAAKPLCAWIGLNAVQDCRESCGGHGYLKGR